MKHDDERDDAVWELADAEDSLWAAAKDLQRAGQHIAADEVAKLAEQTKSLRQRFERKAS